MKNKSPFLFIFVLAVAILFGAAGSAIAASPDYKAFLGTGGITVASNPPSGSITIDGSGIGGGSTPAWTATTGGGGGTNLFIDFTALGSTSDIIFTMGTSNIAIVPTNIVASASRKVVRVGIKQSAAGFGTCTTNLSQYPRMIRIGTTVTGFNLSTNGGYWDVFSLYTLNTNAILSGNLLGFEP